MNNSKNNYINTESHGTWKERLMSTIGLNEHTHVITNAIEWILDCFWISTIRWHIKFTFTRWKFHNVRHFAPASFRKPFQIFGEWQTENENINYYCCYWPWSGCEFLSILICGTWCDGYLRIARYFGKRWMVKLFVLFRRVLHLEHVGISSPSRISSFINRSRQLSNLHRLDVVNGTLKKNKRKKQNMSKCPEVRTWNASALTLNPRMDQMSHYYFHRRCISVNFSIVQQIIP